MGGNSQTLRFKKRFINSERVRYTIYAIDDLFFQKFGFQGARNSCNFCYSNFDLYKLCRFTCTLVTVKYGRSF